MIRTTPPAWALWAAVLALPFAYPIYFIASSLLDRDPPVYYVAAQAITASAKPGDPITTRFETRRYRQCVVQKIQRYARSLTDGYDYAIAEYNVKVADPSRPESGDATKIGTNVYQRSFTVPKMPAGFAEYFIRINYQCNWSHLFWPILVESPHIPFMVEPS